VVAALRRQAEDNGQSLQSYMADLATDLARRPTVRQWAARAATRQRGWTGADVDADDIRAAIDGEAC
jgi:hypothetical protein